MLVRGADSPRVITPLLPLRGHSFNSRPSPSPPSCVPAIQRPRACGPQARSALTTNDLGEEEQLRSLVDSGGAVGVVVLLLRGRGGHAGRRGGEGAGADRDGAGGEARRRQAEAREGAGHCFGWFGCRRPCARCSTRESPAHRGTGSRGSGTVHTVRQRRNYGTRGVWLPLHSAYVRGPKASQEKGKAKR